MLKFNGLHLSKNYIASPKTLFTDLSNITFNWLVVWKMTWGIWQIFSTALKIGILKGSFNPDLKKYELEIDLSTRVIDLPFQNWHKEFDKFWPEHSKVSIIFTLMGFFWGKHILFKLKMYRGVIFYETEEGYKIWRGIDLLFQNWCKQFGKFWPWAPKSPKNIHFNVLLLSKVYSAWTKKVERSYLSWHWRVMQNLKKTTCCLENDMRDLANFHKSSRKCQNWNFDGILLPK